jgi:tetratricopeptide (TPR) repeat protein
MLVVLCGCPASDVEHVLAPPAAVAPAVDSDEGLDASYLAELAQVHLNHQNHRRALDLFTRAMEKEADVALRARLQMRAAEVYGQLGQHEEATRAYEAASAKIADPAQRALVLLRLGQSYARAGKNAEAAAALEKLLGGDVQPYVRDAAHSEVIQLWKALGVIEERVAGFEARVQESPGDTEALRILGAAYATALGKPEAAIPHYEKLAAREPSEFGLAWHLGNLYFQTRQFAKGVAHFRKLAERTPDRKSELYERVASGFASLGKKKDARLWADKMVSGTAQPAPHLFTQHAHLLAGIGEDEQAVKSFDMAITTAGSDAQRQQVRYDLAGFHVSRKQYAEARALLEKLRSETLSPELKAQVTALFGAMPSSESKAEPVAPTPATPRK